MKPELEFLLNIVDIARTAGDRILDIYQKDFTIQVKDDDSPLTEADRAAHHYIVEALGRLTPDIPVLSEESDEEVHAARCQWSRFWLVDPLDGTREFISRNGEFTVNIALIENGESVMGVVHVPVKEKWYYGARETGAFRGSRDNVESIRARAYTGGDPGVVASRSHAGEYLRAALEKMTNTLGTPRLQSMGSSLKFCLVAEGEADVYPRLGPTSEWDTAAAQCVVEAAGGRVVDLSGRPLLYNKPDILNPFFIVSGDPGFPWHEYFATYAETDHK